MISIFFLLLLLLSFGYLLVSAFYDGNFIERIGLSWPFSIGFYTIFLFVFQFTGIHFSLLSILSTLILLNCGLYLKFKKRIHQTFKLDIQNLRRFKLDFDVLEWGMLGLFGIFILSDLFRAIYWPVYYWDALAHYDYRAVLFYKYGTITEAARHAGFVFHPYPPLTSLANSLIYIVSDLNKSPVIVYWLFYISLILTFFSVSRKIVSRKVSLFITLVLVSTPLFWEHGASSYTNLPYAYYLGLSGVYFGLYFLKPGKQLFTIAASLFIFSSWTRSPNESFMLAFFITLLYYHWREKLGYKRLVIFLLSFIILDLSWTAYLRFVVNTFASSLYLSFGQEPISWDVILRVFRVIQLLGITTWGSLQAISLLFIASLLLNIKRLKRFKYLLLLIAINAAIVVGGAYIFSLGWTAWEDLITNSANRLIMFIGPVLLYTGVLLWSERGNHEKKA